MSSTSGQHSVLVCLAAIITAGCVVVALSQVLVLAATPRSPLGDRDILATVRVSNRHQCLRLCWYLQPCARFSFYTRSDNPGGRGDNCVLHEGEELGLTGPLQEGWLEGQAAGDSLAAQHLCKARSCSAGEICLPVSESHVCHLVVPTLADADDCSSSPCGNNGTCLDLLQTFRCVCLPGFTGLQCQQDIDECQSTPCQNNATCVDQVNSYICACPSGYSGDHCQYDIVECQSTPCQHNATCVDQVNSYTCTCPSGYSGNNCQYDTEECQSTPCQNNATCVDQVNSYVCACPSGYSGDHCQYEIDECQSTPCQNNGTCVDQVNSYVCVCLSGYSGDHCQYDTDECQSTPCQNNATCVDQVSSYTCDCLSGYSGGHCQYACSDPPLIPRLAVRHSAVNGSETAVYSCSVPTDIATKGTTTLTCLDHSWIDSPVSLLCAPVNCWYIHTVWGPVYRGTVNQTKSGLACQSWTSDTPHNKTAIYSYSSVYHSDNNLIDNAKNYCRTFLDNYEHVWCYTTNVTLRWEDCAVPACDPIPGVLI